MTDPLFSYGTLMDFDIQSALFGRHIPSEKAVLYGWGLYLSDDGYVFVRPQAGGTVSGVLLNIAPEELGTADLWEEVPVYTRECITVTASDGTGRNAWAYTRRFTIGVPYTGSPLGTNTKDFILREAQALKT